MNAISRFFCRVGCVGLMLAVMVNGHQASAQTNLIQNPGFEAAAMNDPQGRYHWSPNNWAKNVVDCVLDSENPHSGKYSQRITLGKIINHPNYQFMSQPLPVRPEMAVQLRFWMRGRANTMPIGIQFRKLEAPYTNYWKAELPPAQEWREYVFTVVLPKTVDPNDTRLILNLNEETTVWVDDFSLVELPAVDARPEMKGNLIANGSFEAGRDRWYAGFDLNGGYHNYEQATNDNIKANIVSVENTKAPSGHRVLRWPVFSKSAVYLNSAYFPIRYNTPVTVSFKLKGGKPQSKFVAQLINAGGFGNAPAKFGQTFTIPNGDWNSYSFTATLPPSNSGNYVLEFFVDGSIAPGEYELDAVCVNEGDHPINDSQSRRFNAGIEPANDAHPANLFYRHEPARFRVRVENDKPEAATVLFDGRILNAWEEVISTFALQVTCSTNGFGQAEWDVPTTTFGGFKCELRRSGMPLSDLPDAEVIYNVTPKLPKPQHNVESFFGGHAMFTPYNLMVAERAGFRWLRMHPPMQTKWGVVEHQQGQYTFAKEGVERAYRAGFNLLGSFDTTPQFYAQAEHKNLGFWSRFGSLPADWPAYHRYVVATAKAYASQIHHWEIWNEPDAHTFLQIPKGADRSESYLEIVKNTRQAFQQANMDAFLVAPAVSSVYDKLFRQVLTKGSQELNAVSFHYYYENRDILDIKPALMDEYQFVQGLKNIKGQTPELWMTEGGIWLTSWNTWLKTSRIPVDPSTQILDAAHTLVRQLAAFKAIGVTKYFHYIDNAHPAGGQIYRRDCSGMVDVNGIPHAALAAHAVMVGMIDLAQPQGIQVKNAAGARITIASFRRDGRMIQLLWSRTPVHLKQAASWLPSNAVAYDMMGNPLKITDQTMLTLSPIYIVDHDEPVLD